RRSATGSARRGASCARRGEMSSPGDDDGRDRLAAGVTLPAISLPATDGTIIALAELAGRSVVMVYPWTGRPGQPNPPHWDDIPGAHGSTPELEGFRDLRAGFQQVGAAVFGLSAQSTAYQAEMAVRLGLPFEIVSD